MLLWAGQGLSWIGSEISGIAMPLVILSLTGSSAIAGAVIAMRGITYVLLAIPAGYLLDKGKRRHIMLVGNAGSGLAMLVVAIGLLFHRLTIVELFLLMGIEGGCFVFANIGRFSSRRFLVANEQLPQAVAQDSMIEHFAILVGPSVGGLLYQTVGAVFSFATDALSYFFNVVALLFINSPLSVPGALKDIPIRQGLKEAGSWFWQNRLYRIFIMLSWIRTLATSSLSFLVIVLARDLHAPATTIGVVLAMSAVAGIAGSAFFGKVTPLFDRYTILTVSNVLCAGGFLLYVFANSVVALAIITAFLFAILPGFYIICGNIAGEIPHHLQGRVTSITRSGDYLSYSAGLFLVGFALQFLGNTWTITILATLLAVFSLATALHKKLLKLAWGDP
ncbi:MAG: MFS transporter [Ktedonobacteraceae bacterium]|nr:MFS transporter [Ktedonobacteraceae bacterium]